MFGAGLLAAGTATSMAQFVLGRALQGFGSGLMIVSLYILVARAYPGRLHSKAFSVIASCWVLPAIVGPLIAGVLTEDVSWRWVFLGVAALIVVPLAFLVRPLRNVPDLPEPAESATEADPTAKDQDAAARQRTVRICAALTSRQVRSASSSASYSLIA